MRRFDRRRHPLACCAVLALALGCSGSESGGTPSQQAQSLSKGGGITKEELRGLAAKGHYRTRIGAAARQILTADTQSSFKEVIVQLEPDSFAYRLSVPNLNGGAVVARFRKLSEGSIRRFGLTETDSVSHWYVYQAEDGNYMGRFSSDGMDTTYQIKFENHDPHLAKPLPIEKGFAAQIPWRQSVAQFVYWDSTTYQTGNGGGSALMLRPAFIALPFLNVGAVANSVLPALVAGGGSWVSCTPYGCCGA